MSTFSTMNAATRMKLTKYSHAHGSNSIASAMYTGKSSSVSITNSVSIARPMFPHWSGSSSPNQIQPTIP